MNYALLAAGLVIGGFNLGWNLRGWFSVKVPTDPFDNRGIWRCSGCGEMMPMSGEIPFATWRWNGKTWEHQCGNVQVGYEPARYFGEIK